MVKHLLPSLGSAIRASHAAIVSVTCLLLSFSHAHAMGPLMPGFPSACALRASADASTAIATVSSSAETDMTAILDEPPSKLELLRAEQAGISPFGARPATHTQDHMRCVSRAAAGTLPVMPQLPVVLPSLALQLAVVPNTVDKQEVAQSSTDDSGRPNVFGSVALAVGKTPLDRRWNSVRDSRMIGRAGPWSKLLRSQRGQSRAVQIETVNAWVNARISFVDDIKSAGVSDQWASAAQTLRKGSGDCEDYAIAKMQLLRSLGINASDLYLVIARDLVRQADHALLVVRMDGHLLLLDNGTDHITDARTAQDYRPIMSYSGNQSWLHGYQVEPSQIAATVQVASLH